MKTLPVEQYAPLLPEVGSILEGFVQEIEETQRKISALNDELDGQRLILMRHVMSCWTIAEVSGAKIKARADSFAHAA